MGFPASFSRQAGSRLISGRGKTGIALPFSTDGRGRLARTAGEGQLSKVILLNLMDLESANPFQDDLGLGAFMIFAVNNEDLHTELRRRINELFRRLQLQDRAKLARPPSFQTNIAEQELEMNISYVNLEENKPGDISETFSLARSSDVSSTLITALTGG